MKEEFLEYFKSIGIKESVLLRIEMIMKYFCRLLPDEEVMDVFISDYVDSDGTKEYDSLRLLGRKKGLLASGFMNKDDFHISDLVEKLSSVKIEANNYDFEKATSMSRFYIRKFYTYGALSEYRASMENCDRLMRIYEKYILPSLNL